MVVIDKIQRVPALLSVIHHLIEERAAERFVLTGSSARKLRREAAVDLLGGRAVSRTMQPFMAAELGQSAPGSPAPVPSLASTSRPPERPRAGLQATTATPRAASQDEASRLDERHCRLIRTRPDILWGRKGLDRRERCGIFETHVQALHAIGPVADQYHSGRVDRGPAGLRDRSFTIRDQGCRKN